MDTSVICVGHLVKIGMSFHIVHIVQRNMPTQMILILKLDSVVLIACNGAVVCCTFF